MLKPITLSIDTKTKNIVESYNDITKGDTLILNITMYQNSVSLDLTGQTIHILLRKPDGYNIENILTGVTGNTFSSEFSEQATLAEGEVEGEIQLIDSNGVSISNKFIFVVGETIADDIMEASASSIQTLIDIEKLLAVSISQEVVTSRNGYESLNERLDGSDLKFGNLGVINVKDYGAKGDGSTDDTTSIQNAINYRNLIGKGIIYIPDGTYIVTNIIRLYEGITLFMHSGAIIKRGNGAADLRIFVNGEVGNDTYASGYDGDGNISIIGGTIDLSGDIYPPEIGGYGAVALTFGHSKNIILKNLTIKNGINTHYIELNSTQNATIRDCTFENMTINGINGYEMLQIDAESEEGFPVFGYYDLTTCENIIIENCKFSNGQRGIGTHSSTYDSNGYQILHKNVKIINCTFENMVQYGVRAESWKECIISNNIIKGIGTNGVLLIACQNINIKDNVIDTCESYGIVGYEKTMLDSSVIKNKNINISNNIVKNTTTAGISLHQTNYGLISNNIIEDHILWGMYFKDDNYIKCKNNILRNVGADTVPSSPAIRLDNSNDCELKDNTIKNDSVLYTYLIQLDSTSNRNVLEDNIGDSGSGGVINNSGISTVIINNSDSGWTGISLNGGFSERSSSFTPQYRKIGNRMYLRGNIIGTITANTITPIFTLPSGYRPTQEHDFSIILSGTILAIGFISTSGVVSLKTFSDVTTSTYIPLGNIAPFLVD